MFGLLKFLFFSFVAVVVGVVIGTVPFDGKTVAERIAALYEGGAPALGELKVKKAVEPVQQQTRPAPKPAAPAAKALAAAPRPSTAKAVAAAPKAPKAPVSAGAANTPDGHTADDKAEFDKLLAMRVKGR